MTSAAETTGRVRIVVRFALVWAIVVFVRLFVLQVIQHKELVHAAQSQQLLQAEIQGPRGTIFDRNGLPLAKSLPVDSVCVNPLRVPDAATAAHLLAPVLNLDPTEVYEDIQKAAENRRGFLWIKRRITPDESTRLRSMNLEWVEFRTESRRFYPNGQLASHAIGSVDHKEHGNSGLELALDEELAGKAGEVKMLADSRHNVYGEEVKTEPVPGKDLYTTLDARIQYEAEAQLSQAVTASHARSGSLVALNPANGEVLAVANYPTFDPNVPPKPEEPLANRNNLAITSPYEPGSVFKVSTLIAGLENRKITPATLISCNALKIGNHTYKESHAGYYGTLSVADVLAKSSNLGAIQIGMRIGSDPLQQWVRALGFGKPTGIELPSESGGRVRKQWSTMTLASVSMGHEVMVTAMQLAQLGAIVANGGLLVKPHLVTKKSSAGQTELVSVEKPKRVIRPETAILMRQMMERVVLTGTARGKANIKGYTSGGKTGTAMIYNAATHQYTHFYNGSFLGFAPVANPQIVIVVTLNGTTGTAGYGASVAAPVFRDVAAAALRILDVPKDLPENAPPIQEDRNNPGDVAIAGLENPEIDFGSFDSPTALAQGTDAPGQRLFSESGALVPNFRGKSMREVLEQAAASGIQVEIVGRGVARLQMPAPGSMLPPGEKIRVQFTR